MRQPPINVLVVIGPNEGLDALLQQKLERRGYLVTLAGNAQEAQGAVIREKGGFHSVITEYDMPFLNGIQLILWIKERYSAIRTFLMTDRIENVLEAALAAGVDDIFEKPLDLNLLPAAIEKKRADEERKPLGVLVVDDDEEIRYMLTELLQSEGHSVSTAADGQEALEMIRRDAGYDLVITDHNMPRLLGVELVRLIKKGFPLMKIILMSAREDLDSVAFTAGASAVLRKPFRANEMLSAIVRTCAQTDPQAPVAHQ
ncbi:MAG: response regulator [Patescibacteria group bacterium]|nr:response regulator [Patescibacteria group bacterium]